MYLDFFGLREPPFELTATPSYLYLTPHHREALSNLQYGLSTAKAVTLLTGEAGTGKTTLLRAALESDRCSHVRAVSINNPTLERSEFIEMLARSFGLSPLARQSKVVMLEELENVLNERRSRGEIAALVVDEAQSLSTEILEEIRLLANIESPAHKLLPLVLAGQPELGLRLEDPALRQLKQRVALRCELVPLTVAETAVYIATRIKTAGGVAARLFTREAVMLIHEYSQGIPRTVSVICDNALAGAFALGRQPVDCSLVREVGRDFRLAPRDHTAGLATASVRARVSHVDPTSPSEDGTRGGDASDRDAEDEEPSDSAADAQLRLLGGRRR